MEELCKNCKFFGEERLVYEGKTIDHFRRCEKAMAYGARMYTYSESDCDEDLNAFKAKDGIENECT